VTNVIGSGFIRDLLPALFFLLVLFRQLFLTFFELIVWFGQKVTFGRRTGRMKSTLRNDQQDAA